MSASTQSPLTRFVKRLLDVARVLIFLSLVLWLLFAIVMAISQDSVAGTWGVDISVFARFVIDLNVFAVEIGESIGVRDPIISGKTALKVDTSSLMALYVFTATMEISGVFGLYIVLQLRTLFAALINDAPFAQENAERIKKIGISVIVWTLATPLLQYFGGRAILAEYSLQVPGVSLYPAFEINGLGIFVGLTLIVLSAVLSEAATINEAQELTI